MQLTYVCGQLEPSDCFFSNQKKKKCIITTTDNQQQQKEKENDNQTRFYPFILDSVIGSKKSMSNLLVYSILLLMRKHVLFHFESGSGIGKVQKSSIDSNQRKFDMLLFQHKYVDFACAIGFNELPSAHQYVLRILNYLKSIAIPPCIEMQCEDYQFLVNHLKIPTCDIEDLFLNDNDSCKCPSEEKCNNLLVSSFVDIYTNTIVKNEGCSLQKARQKASMMSNDEVKKGALRLAIELWSMDFNFSACPVKCGIKEKQCNYDFNFNSSCCSLPPTFQVMISSGDGSGCNNNSPTTTIIPRRTSGIGSKFPTPKNKFNDSTYSAESDYESDSYFYSEDDDGLNDYDDDDDDVICKKMQIERDEWNLDKRFNMNAQLNHPYVQHKLQILINRGYTPEIATKLLVWSLLPSNMTIPFPLLVLMLRCCHNTIDDNVGEIV